VAPSTHPLGPQHGSYRPSKTWQLEAASATTRLDGDHRASDRPQYTYIAAR
jgi:hypothetical protein